MAERYQSLYQLLARDQHAQDYFLNLPDYIRDQIELHPPKHCSLQTLQQQVDQMMNRPFYS